MASTGVRYRYHPGPGEHEGSGVRHKGVRNGTWFGPHWSWGLRSHTRTGTACDKARSPKAEFIVPIDSEIFRRESSQLRISQVRETWAEQLLPAGENNENGDRAMFTRILSACFVSLAAVSVSGAQDFTRMDLNAMNNAFNNSQNQQMNSQLESLIKAKMNDPSFQAAYKQHVAQGGRSTPQQFAYWHAATLGGSAEGMAYFRESEARNRVGEQNSLNAYRQAQAARGQAQTEWMNGFQRNNTEFGNTLRGTRLTRTRTAVPTPSCRTPCKPGNTTGTRRVTSFKWTPEATTTSTAMGTGTRSTPVANQNASNREPRRGNHRGFFARDSDIDNN